MMPGMIRDLYNIRFKYDNQIAGNKLRKQLGL